LYSAYPYLDRYGYSKFIEDFARTIHINGIILKSKLTPLTNNEKTYEIYKILHTHNMGTKKKKKKTSIKKVKINLRKKNIKVKLI
jgi:hypothetical protein